MGFEKGNSVGRQWKKGQSGNPKGKPKKIYRILKEKGFGKQDLKDCMLELMFYTDKELEEVINNTKDFPQIMQIIAQAILKGKKSGDMSRVKDLLEHTMGKPTSTQNVSLTGAKLGIDFIDDNE